MDKRQAILQVMLRLITEQGIHATPMAQVAKEAGVAAGTIYHYFSSKEQLVNELYLEVKREFGQVLNLHLLVDLPFKEQFWKIWQALYQYYVENPLAFGFSAQLAHSPLIASEIKETGKTHYQPIYDFFTAGMQQGLLKPMDVTLMAELIYGNVAVTVQLQQSGESSISPELLEQAIQFSWDGVAIQ